MPINTLIKTGINALLGGAAVKILAENAEDKVVSALHEHLTFSALAETYQKSYNYALAAISTGLAAQPHPIDLQAFAAQRGIPSENLPALRQRLIEKINQLVKLPPIFLGENRRLTESELVAAINHQETVAITDLIFAQLRLQKVALDNEEEWVAFLSFEDLLGKATLHFFIEILRKEPRTESLFYALQREGIWADMRDLKNAQKALSVNLQQQREALRAAAMQALQNDDFSRVRQMTLQLEHLQQSLDQVPQRLQAAHAAWQSSLQHLIEFSHRFKTWADLSAVKTEIPSLRKGGIKVGEVFCDSLKDGSEGPEMVWIPAGHFRMGDIQGTGRDNEQPVHEVSLESFAMGRYPVTVGEFRQFVEATGYKTEAEKEDGAWVHKDNKWQQLKDANWYNPYFSAHNDNHPVVCVSWNDVVAYIKWLNEQTQQQYRLPTEAEWEYAARAGTETDYWWGNEIGKNRANCRSSGTQWSNKQTSPVGSFEPNPFGLYDTVGNVWEWTYSKYENKYQGAEKICNNNSSRRVIRGGSWAFSSWSARVAYRNDGGWNVWSMYDVLGLRLLRSPR